MSEKRVRVGWWKNGDYHTRTEPLEDWLADTLNSEFVESKARKSALVLSRLLDALAEKGLLSVEEVIEVVNLQYEDVEDAEGKVGDGRS